MFATVSIDNFSFPSGHTTRATMLAYLCSMLSGTELTAIVTSAFVWATCVAFSRVMMGEHSHLSLAHRRHNRAHTHTHANIHAGRHHVLDVVAGWVIGLLIFETAHYALWLSPASAVAARHALLRVIGLD
jgi:membrane-associated phospholipid phosphatase